MQTKINDIFLPCLQEMSPHEKAIRRDLNRTFPEHSFFKERDGVGQESLFNVLKAYSVHDKEVGYCQGSPFMVGLLLMQVRGGGARGGAKEVGYARVAPSLLQVIEGGSRGGAKDMRCCGVATG